MRNQTGGTHLDNILKRHVGSYASILTSIRRGANMEKSERNGIKLVLARVPSAIVFAPAQCPQSAVRKVMYGVPLGSL